ncbi:DUF465 domain-containing protein [Bartonella sp. DGB2]|uniref:DUF465 domain-containing protein n=1 Tax=Bartonella sp. DGB2 TaxID=3388426 RepID=UPI00398FE8A9
MGKSAYLEALEKKHHALEIEISQTRASPSYNDLDLNDLKRKKLLLKEEIEKLKHNADS